MEHEDGMSLVNRHNQYEQSAEDSRMQDSMAESQREEISTVQESQMRNEETYSNL